MCVCKRHKNFINVFTNKSIISFIIFDKVRVINMINSDTFFSICTMISIWILMALEKFMRKEWNAWVWALFCWICLWEKFSFSSEFEFIWRAFIVFSAKIFQGNKFVGSRIKQKFSFSNLHKKKNLLA